MSKKFTGQWAASPANINTDAPFDVRLVVSNLSDLLSASTYNKGLELYPGIVVAVIESGKESLWSLPNEAALTSMRQTFASASYVPAEATEENVKALGWKKVGADAKVEIDGEVKTIQEAINTIVSDVKTKQNSAITVTTEAAVGDGEPVTKETTVLAALNELYQKTNGVATEGNLKALENKVTVLEGTVNGAEMGNAALKSSIDSLQSKVEAIKQFNVVVVDGAKPETGEPNTIYLVTPADGSDNKEEWLYVNGAWELIGTNHVSLDGYATETYVDGKASTAKSEAIAAAKTETEGQVSAAKTELTSAIATAKQEAIDAAATDATSKANTAETNAKAYTDTEVAKVTPESLAGTPEKKASWKSLLSFIESNEVKEITNVVAVENGVEVASKEVIKYYSIQANTAASITVSSTAVSKLSFTGANTSVELEIDGTTGETVVESIIGSNVLTVSGETPLVSITSTVAGTLKVSYIKEA